MGDSKIIQIIPCTRRINALFRDADNGKIIKIPVLGFALWENETLGNYILPFVFDIEDGAYETPENAENFIRYEMEDMKGEDDNADTCK